MSSLSEKQLESLSLLWTAISSEMREQLKAAAGTSGKLADVFARLDEGLDGSRCNTLLFRIFTDVTGAEGLPPTHARFTSTHLEKLNELAGGDAQVDASDRDALHAWRVNAAEQIAEKLKQSEQDKAVLQQLKRDFGDEYASLLSDAMTLLQNDQVLHEALEPFPESIKDLSTELVIAARDAYETICNNAPDASLWFLKILTARLERTAQIFRVVEKIGRRSDDALVSKTDLADIGDLVLANAAFYAGQLTETPTTLADAEAASHAVAEYVKISVGMTREFGIRKDGHWGKTLFAIRAKASAALERFFSEFEKSFPRALPYPVKGKKGLTKAGDLPPAATIEQAEAGLCLLAATGEWASQAAVGSAQKHVADAVRNGLDECARDLLEVLRAAEDEEAARAAESIALIVRYMRAFEDDENADLIQRRSAALQANAA
jgi:hypothetical protein